MKRVDRQTPSLFGETSFPDTTAPGREQPAIWVETLEVHAGWPPGPETCLRRITLRRGLNIVWARPTPEAENEDIPAARLWGHGAGKTTFCRLLRYILHEAHPGTAAFRRDFVRWLGDRSGWALAEVWLEGKRWLVGRPIGGSGYPPFARCGGSLSDPWPTAPIPAGSYRAYTDALEAAAFGKLELRTLSGSGRALHWDCLLPWLSRDQEAHYAGLLKWRDRDSESASPDLIETDKENLVRLMLGLIAKDEQKLLREHAAKADTHKANLRERLPARKYALRREAKRLQEALGSPVPALGDELFYRQVEKEATALRRESDEALAAVGDDAELERLLSTLGIAEARWAAIAGKMTRTKVDVAVLESGVAAKAGGMSDDHFARLGRLFPAPVGGYYCSAPMKEARGAGCRLAAQYAQDKEMERSLTQARPEERREEAQLAVQAQRLAAQTAALKELEEARDLARKMVTERRQALTQEQAPLTAPLQRAQSIEFALQGYRDATTEFDKLQTETNKLGKEKDALDRELNDLTRQHDGIIRAFSDLFCRFAQAMLGPEINGWVEFSGKSIEPVLEYKGRRDSAALKVTKLLAFDLAALALGVRNPEVHHPRFLLHDSPREADLAADIYRALFAAAQELTGEDNENAAFQYIVTTTEPPPKGLQSLPWLRATLNAGSAAGRFLGVDL